MGVLVETLEEKFSKTEPPLDVRAGIRQESQLDARTNMAQTVEEMDAFIGERLQAREGEALMVLSQSKFPFPCPPEQWPLAWANRSNDQRAGIAGFQLQTAAEAVEQYVLGDLYLKASNRQPELFLGKAVFYLGDKSLGKKGLADITLEKVLASVNQMGEDPINVIKSNRIQTSQMTVGDEGRDEYRADRFEGYTPNDLWPQEIIDYRKPF